MTILLLVCLQHHTKPLRVILVLHRPAALELGPTQYGARGQFYIPSIWPPDPLSGRSSPKDEYEPISTIRRPSEWVSGPYRAYSSTTIIIIVLTVGRSHPNSVELKPYEKSLSMESQVSDKPGYTWMMTSGYTDRSTLS